LNKDAQNSLFAYRKDLIHKSGVYGIVNKLSHIQYIGSSTNLYNRLREHLKYPKKSNIRLQYAINKYGIENFKFVIYAYESANLKNLIHLETYYLSLFSKLYNFKFEAESMKGYKLFHFSNEIVYN
jgi:group I intron endonuclease